MIPNKTKILATIGPACSNHKTLQQMVDVGVNAFRINMSHGSLDDKKSLFKQIKKQNFINISYRNLSGGIVAIHSAWKI